MLALMQFRLNLKKLINQQGIKTTLKVLLCVILLQQSILHHSNHDAKLDNPCLVCFSQANLDSGLITDEFKLQVLVTTFERIATVIIDVKSQPLVGFRNRSPPL